MKLSGWSVIIMVALATIIVAILVKLIAMFIVPILVFLTLAIVIIIGAYYLIRYKTKQLNKK